MTSTVLSSPKSRLEIRFLTDKLYDELSTCKFHSSAPKPDDVLEFDSRKYYDEAYKYHKILILAAKGKPTPYFLVSLSDLSVTLKSKLDSLNVAQLRGLLKAGVLTIFQDIEGNYNEVFQDTESKQYFIHLSNDIAKILKLRFVS